MRRRHFLRFRDGRPEVRLERRRWEELPGLDEIRVQYVGGRACIVSLGPKSFLTEPGSDLGGVCLVAAGLMLDHVVGFTDLRADVKEGATAALRDLAKWIQGRLEPRFPKDYWTAAAVMKE